MARAAKLRLVRRSVRLFFGCIVIADERFETYRLAHDAAGELAFCFGGFIGLIALLVATHDD